MQGAASVALVRRPLAGRALTGLGPAPLAGPIGAKAPRYTLFKVAFVTLKPAAALGFYYTPFMVAARGLGCLTVI